MWLLNIDRLDRPALVQASEESAPRYAILSHTWGREEVTFQDVQALNRKQWSRAVSQTALAIQNKKGFIKIRKAAALAAEHGYSYIWVDTCCIDKTSSAELSEAINSMFRWYKKASICYAYMEDVRHGYHDSKGGLFSLLCQRSRWFTRGWTLQELIAPDDVMFYGEDWGYLGSKAHDEDVRISLAEITGIDVRVLEGTIQPSEISIAGRMKWASRRETTRLEDVAYCLMGLFDVNMPLLYGEGTKAFIRLQEEILKGSNDHSIFAWKAPEVGSNEVLSGLLAETPHHFTQVENYRPMPPSLSQASTAWSTTNRGLRLSLFLLPRQDLDGNEMKDEYNAVLECAIRHGDEAYRSPAIRMRRLYGDQFARVDPQIVERVATPSFESGQDRGSYVTVFVKQRPVYAVPDFMVSFSNILPSSESQGPGHSCHITKVWPEKYWDEETATLRTMPSPSNRIIGLFRFFAPTIVATVDFAVGLRRNPGGAWVVWHLQRPSTGEPLHQTVASVNGYLASVSRNPQPPLRFPDWLENPWKEAGENQPLQIRLEEIKVHGRTYIFVKASVAIELPAIGLPDIPASPFSGLSGPKKEPTTFEFPVITWGRRYYLEQPGNHNLGSCPLPPIIQGYGEMETKLLRACKDGRGQDVSELIHHDLNYDQVKFCDFRPIHWAVIGGHIEVIRTLLDNGVDFYSRTNQGWSSVHLAALFGRFVTMKWLIEYAIEKYRSSYYDGTLLDDRSSSLLESPLHLAVSHVSLAVGDELIALTEILEKLRGSTFWTSRNHAGETPLHRLTASVSTWSPTSASIIENVMSYRRRFKFPGKYLDKLGRTVLWHAVCAGSASQVEYLMQDDAATLSMTDKNGMNPLHAACHLGHAKVTRALLQAGADPNATTKDPGLTATHFAAVCNHPDCLQELITHGADIHKPTECEEKSFRSIHLAAKTRYQRALSILRHAGGDAESIFPHYIFRSASLQGGRLNYQCELLEHVKECDKRSTYP
ncbi:hypothetical protein F4823DRAFT_627989 [Ustulina deusta]|nr:hypothetical protein F4823DRAFT_627989 [Ustulina deusta]